MEEGGYGDSYIWFMAVAEFVRRKEKRWNSQEEIGRLLWKELCFLNCETIDNS